MKTRDNKRKIAEESNASDVGRRDLGKDTSSAADPSALSLTASSKNNSGTAKIDPTATKRRKLVESSTATKGGNLQSSKLDEATWNRNFALLRTQHRKNGHCRLPYSFAVNSVRLGVWVSRQKSLYKNFMEGKDNVRITQERIYQLNSIGFEWGLRKDETHEDAWNQNFDLLREFHQKHGNYCIPYNFQVDSVRLGAWVSRQRQYHKKLMEGKGKAFITQERIDRLSSIGFEWSCRAEVQDAAWYQNFKLLRTFHRREGHFRVPYYDVVESVRLGVWVSRQRSYYKRLKEGQDKAYITQEHIEQLNSIDFAW